MYKSKSFEFNIKMTCGNINKEYMVEAVFSANFYKGCRGSRDRYGVPLEPDDPDEWDEHTVEVTGIVVINDNDDNLKDITEAESKTLGELIMGMLETSDDLQREVNDSLDEDMRSDVDFPDEN